MKITKFLVFTFTFISVFASNLLAQTTDLSISSVTYSKYDPINGTQPATSGEKVYFTITLAQLGAQNNLSITDPVDARLILPTNIPGASYSPPIGNSVNINSHSTIQTPSRETFQVNFDGNKTTASIEVGYMITNAAIFNSSASCFTIYIRDTNMLVPNGPTSLDPDLTNNYITGCYPYGTWTYTGPIGCNPPQAKLETTFPDYVCHPQGGATTTLENIGFQSFQKLCNNNNVNAQVEFLIQPNDGAVIANSSIINDGYEQIMGQQYHRYKANYSVTDTFHKQIQFQLELKNLGTPRTIPTEVRLTLYDATTNLVLETRIINPQIVIQGPGCTVSTTQVAPEAPEVKVYPNPATEYLNLEFGDEYSEYTVEMYTVTGQLVYQANSSWESEHQIPVYNVNKGVYMLRVVNEEDGTQFTKQVIVTR